MRALVRSTKRPSKRASSATLAGIDLEGAASASAQVAAIGGVADQRLVATPELAGRSAAIDRRPVGGILGRLGLVAADDVAAALSAHLLDEELGLRAAGARMQSGVIGRASSSTTWRTSLSVRSRAPRMYSSPRSSSAAMVAAVIMPRSATTQTRPMREALAQAVDHRHQHADIGGIARPHLRADRPALVRRSRRQRSSASGRAGGPCE